MVLYPVVEISMVSSCQGILNSIPTELGWEEELMHLLHKIRKNQAYWKNIGFGS